jgi:hypothetical protein
MRPVIAARRRCSRADGAEDDRGRLDSSGPPDVHHRGPFFARPHFRACRLGGEMSLTSVLGSPARAVPGHRVGEDPRPRPSPPTGGPRGLKRAPARQEKNTR